MILPYLLFLGNNNNIIGSNVLNTKLSIKLFRESPKAKLNPINRIIYILLG
jgi:hypothetical protein